MFDYQSPIFAGVVNNANNLNDEILKIYEDTAHAEINTAIGFNIDKEELIKALAYDRNQYEKGYQDGKAEAKLGTGWISVNERLPEEDVRVLVVGKRGGIQIARSIECGSCSNGRLWISDTRKYPKSTHWTPLPELPEKVNEDDEP